MVQNIDLITKEKILSFLPSAISQALVSYEGFIAMEKQEGSKEFLAYHNGCKAAIAHLELLLKLAQWANIDNELVQENQNISMLLETARERLEVHRSNNDA